MGDEAAFKLAEAMDRLASAIEKHAAAQAPIYAPQPYPVYPTPVYPTFPIWPPYITTYGPALSTGGLIATAGMQ